MAQEKRKITLGFDHYDLMEGGHICLLFRSESERLRVMSRFMRSGFEAKEKLLYLVDTMEPDEFIDTMKSYDVDLAAVSDDLELLQAAPTYCPDGRFDSDRMIQTLSDYYVGTQASCSCGVRGTGEMTWALTEGRAEKMELFRYESKINQLLRHSPMTVCCQYDTNRFDANTIMDVLEVHPLMIVNEKLVKNPLYVDPETYLAARIGH